VIGEIRLKERERLLDDCLRRSLELDEVGV
jgi:hypothetical protein